MEEYKETVLDFNKLAGTKNFHEWKIDIEMLLRDRGLYGIISGTDPEPPETATAGEKASYARKCDKTISIIYRSLESAVKPLIVSLKNPTEAWKKLQENFEPSCKALVGRLLSEFYSATMQEGETVSLYLSRLEDLCLQLKNLDCEINDKHLAYKMISNLPSRFTIIVQQVYQLDDKDFTSIKVSQSLLAEEGRIQNETHSNFEPSFNSNPSTYLNVTKAKNESNRTNNKTVNVRTQKFVKMKCFNCGLLGHGYRFCTMPPKRKINRNFQKSSDLRAKSLNYGSFVIHDIPEDHSYSESVFENICYKDESVFLFDSGASSHFCSDHNLFNDLKPIHKVVKQGKGEIVALGIGNISVVLKDEKDYVHVNVEDVLYVPGMTRNLFSLGVLEQKGWTFKGSNGYLYIYDKCGNIFLKVSNKNCLYPINAYKVINTEVNANLINPSNKSCSLNIWHKRCAHINAGTVYKCINSNIVLGVPEVKKELVSCHDCILGKLKREPFKRLKGVTTTRPLQLLYADLWGPAPVISKGGAKYFVAIVDDYSRWLTTFPLKNKNDAASAILNFIKSSEREIGVKTVSLRTDHGLEFCNKTLNLALQKEGIKHQLSNPYCPEMMGTVEKINGDAMNAVRTLLASSKLNAEFWAEALQCYVHVRNRISHSIDKKVTPYERFYGRKPNIGYFRVFGSLCFMHIPKVKRNKLQPKSEKGILVGYATSTKGYRVYDLSADAVIETKNVKIDESNLGSDQFKSNYIKTNVFKNFEDFSDCDDSDYTETNKIKSVFDDQKESDVVSKCNEASGSKGNLNDWTRKEVDRTKSSRVDVYYYAPDGTRCRSQKDVLKCAKKLGIVVDVNLFDFKPSRKHMSKIKMCDGEESLSETDLSDISDGVSEKEVNHMVYFVEVPQSYEEVQNSKHRVEWENSMNDELNSIEKRNVWEIVDKPEGCKTITSRWVYTLKNNIDGSVNKFKSRLVAHGHKQRMGVDYFSTFSPVVDFSLVKLFYVILVIIGKWEHRHCDVKNAYLYSNLEEVIHMEIPKGYKVPDNVNFKNPVLKLLKSLYGLKQSGRNFYFHISDKLKAFGFTCSKYCPCLFKIEDCIILLYVDDLAIFAKNQNILDNVYMYLSNIFEIKNLGKIHNFLGVQFEEKDGCILMHQHAYINKLIQTFPVDSNIPVKTPMDVGIVSSVPDEEIDFDFPFRELLGSLLYLANRTRPDILFPVIYVAQFTSKPNLFHFTMLLRILKYVKCTKCYSIDLSKADSYNLVMYSDASWATAVDSRRSISGYIWSIGNVFLGWRSCIQKCIAKSTMESEFVALDSAATEVVWLSNIVNECKIWCSNLKPVVYCDNQSAIFFSTNNVVNNRTKHIDVRFCYVKDLIQRDQLFVKYVSSKDNVSDFLTKAVLKSRLSFFIKRIFVNGGEIVN